MATVFIGFPSGGSRRASSDCSSRCRHPKRQPAQTAVVSPASGVECSRSGPWWKSRAGSQSWQRPSAAIGL